MSAHTCRVLSLLVTSAFLFQSPVTVYGQQLVHAAEQIHNAAPAAATILSPSQIEGLLPATVYFQGKTAPVELRNSGGIHFEDAGYLLTAIVDNSGYASGVQERYQFYLLTDVVLNIAGRRLAPGAYGAGILGDQLIVMDIGGHQLFQADTSLDASMKRPRPLQILPEQPGMFKLYIGKRWVRIASPN